MALPLVVGGADPARLTPIWPAAPGWGMAKGMLAAVVPVLFAYDGWIALGPLAEEVREPSRNLPRALIGGMAVLIFLYLGTTLAYHLVLSLDEVITVARGAEGGAPALIAAEYCRRLVGPKGVVAISVLVMISTFSALNGNALTFPRTLFAMARDGLLPRRLARVHPRFLTPSDAILVQSAWAILVTIVATIAIAAPLPAPGSGLPAPVRAAWEALHRTPLYDLLITYDIFGATVFYMMAISSVFVLRARHADWPRPYRTWGYPVTPALYVLASLLLAGSMLRQTPAESCAGLGIIILGVPAYWLFSRHSTKAPRLP
jgi:APA family basic amino acid/polyamine antiporter